MHLHVCCKRDRKTFKAPNRIDLGGGRIQTGVWAVSDRFLDGVTHVWLHDGQKMDPYCGGEILDMRKSVPKDAPDGCPINVHDCWTFTYRKQPSAGRKTSENWKNNAWTVEPS